MEETETADHDIVIKFLRQPIFGRELPSGNMKFTCKIF